MSEIRCSTLMIEPSENCYDICVLSNRCGALKEWEREKQKANIRTAEQKMEVEHD